MGVSLADEEQEQEQGQDNHHQSGQDAVEGTGTRALAHEDDGEGWRWRRRWRRRHWSSAGGGGGWWRLCRDDARVPTSLGHFLDMERQLSGAGLLCGGDGAEKRDATAATAVAVAADETGRWKLRRLAQGTSSSLARLPVLLTAICSGGAA
jgi:hypothetical protein